MNFRNTLKTNEKGHLEIGGVDCLDLAKQFGTPLYVMDEQYIIDICNCYLQALKKFYPNSLCTYASKAFSCLDIYRTMKNLGMGIDVVSMGEMFTCMQVGTNLENVFFHGNNKTNEELKFAIENNVGRIVVDGFSEIQRLNEIAGQMNKVPKVLLRINPGVEAHTHHYIQTANVDSKFGFAIQNGYAIKAVEAVLQAKNLQFVGLHCHIGSQIFETESFKIAVNKMTDFIKVIKDKLKADVVELDMGGGYGIWYSDDDAKRPASDYAEYVEVIANALIEDIASKGIVAPKLILEPGRSIVGEAGITLYTVGDIKHIEGLKKYIAVDGGMFENPRFALYQSKYTPCLCRDVLNKDVDKVSIAGKCCESGCLIGEDMTLPKSVKSGDIVAVFSTGAYNYSMASNYNRNLIPAVVKVKNGKASFMVKGQTVQDLIRNDV